MLHLPPFRALAFIGRQGTRAVAASVFLGLALPPLAAWAKPLLLPCIIVLMVLSFLRMDLSRLRTSRQTGTVLLAVVWIMGLLPAAFGFAVSHVFPPSDNGLMLALVLQAAAPPVMSVPAFAALLGLDATLSLSVMVLSLLVCPLTAPILVAGFTDGALALDSLALALRLGLLLAVTLVAGLGLRALLGPARVAQAKEHIDGINVLLLLIFAIAIMDGVAARMIADPLTMAAWTALTFLVSLSALALTFFLFRRAGRGQDLMVGFAAGHRNLGLMIAATSGAVPQSTWLYVALAQFPIYLLPYLVGPLMHHFVPRAPDDARPET